MTVIDLGPVGPDDYKPPPDRNLHRRVSPVGAVAAMLTVLLAGYVAGTAPRSWLPTVHQIGPLQEDRPTTHVVGDLLLDLNFARGVLRAHELDGRGLRWQVGFEPGTWPVVQPAGGLAIVTLTWPARTDGDMQPQTSAAGIRALDLVTGWEIWRHDGFTVSDVERGLVVVRGAGDWMAGVDTATGVEAWRREWPARLRIAAANFAPGDHPPEGTVTVAVADGTVEVVDMLTGRTQRAAHVRPGDFEVYTWKDLIGVTYYTSDGVATRFAAYRFGHDGLLWERTLGSGTGGPWPCSETTICLRGGGGTVDHLDPGTGRMLPAPDSYDPALPVPLTGGWDLIGDVAGHQLATRRSTGGPPYVTWLGVKSADNIRPLMPLVAGTVFCETADRWLVCNDERVPRSAHAVRASDLERLIDKLG